MRFCRARILPRVLAFAKIVFARRRKTWLEKSPKNPVSEEIGVLSNAQGPEALSSGNYIFEADMNQDEMVNLLDVDLFIEAIAGN